MLKILFEDRHILCVEKPVGVLSQSGADGNGMDDMVSLLTARERRNGIQEPYIGVVHRLDAGVGGVMVYAKKPYGAAILSEAIRERNFVKEYLAVVSGVPTVMTGEYRDFLWKDARQNKVFVVDRMRAGVKEALLSYRVLETCVHDGETYSLLCVTLGTGRSHQIRCQLSHHGTPILCDGKYGGHRPADVSMAGIALWSYHLRFSHPANRSRTENREEALSPRRKKRQEKKQVFANPDVYCLPDRTQAPWCWFDAFDAVIESPKTNIRSGM